MLICSLWTWESLSYASFLHVSLEQWLSQSVCVVAMSPSHPSLLTVRVPGVLPGLSSPTDIIPSMKGFPDSTTQINHRFLIPLGSEIPEASLSSEGQYCGFLYFFMNLIISAFSLSEILQNCWPDFPHVGSFLSAISLDFGFPIFYHTSKFYSSTPSFIYLQESHVCILCVIIIVAHVWLIFNFININSLFIYPGALVIS